MTGKSRHQEDRFGNRPGFSRMSPQAPRPLENQIDRREVGCNQVEIQVKTLFRHLGGNENFTAIPISTYPEGLQDLFFALLPPVGRKARVEKKHLRPIGEAFANTLAFALQRLTLGEKPVQVLGSLNRIDQR